MKAMDSRGFSLAELLVVIVILGILAGIAAIALRKASAYDVNVTAADQVKQLLRAARAEAIARDTYVDFSLVSQNSSAIRVLKKASGSYSVDTSAPATKSGIIKDNIAIGSPYSRNTISVLCSKSTTPGQYGVVFDSQGRVDNATTSPQITVVNSGQTTTLTVDITTGYVH